MLTNILDTFGKLVYERILVRARELAKRNGDEPVVDGAFSSADIPQPAKETCRNWFLRLCIRELVPRLCVEMALMKCYNFLENGVIRRVVTRSSGIIRGIGTHLLPAGPTSTSAGLQHSYCLEKRSCQRCCRTIYSLGSRSSP